MPNREAALLALVQLKKRALLLVRVSLGWNAVEAVIALGAGIAAGSISLIGFGADSVIETTASLAVLLRLSGRFPIFTERFTLRIIGGTFLALAAYVLFEAVSDLVGRHEPEASVVGIVLASFSLVVMPALSLAKIRVGRRLKSASLVAEAKETLVCAYLSFTLLLGLSLNAAFGWWWADPVAALAMIPMLLREGIEALRGEES